MSYGPLRAGFGYFMKYVTAFHTDAGTRKKVNQDSFLCVQASAGENNILFAAVCDGCGGLEMGEEASGTLVKHLSEWFRTQMPKLLDRGFSSDRLKKSLRKAVSRAHQDILDSAAARGSESGTTCAALLIFGGNYYILNVGDSRIYLISDGLYQLTKDHTVVQQQIDLGRMTYEEAAGDPGRSVLTRCVGTGSDPVPDFFTGSAICGRTFLLCTDGFTHMIAPSEICTYLAPSRCTSRPVIQSSLKYLTDLCMSRGERDNITALIIRTC